MTVTCCHASDLCLVDRIPEFLRQGPKIGTYLRSHGRYLPLVCKILGILGHGILIGVASSLACHLSSEYRCESYLCHYVRQELQLLACLMVMGSVSQWGGTET